MLHIPPTNILLLAAKQEPYKNVYLLMNNIEDVSGKKSREWPAGRKKKDETERVTGLSKRRREEMIKWNQITALRFQVEGGGETSDIPSLSLEGTSLGLGKGKDSPTGLGDFFPSPVEAMMV